MRTLMGTIIVAGTLDSAFAAPAFAQDAVADTTTEGGAGAADDVGARLDVLTCSEFLQVEAQDQMTLMLALRARYNGEALPDEPLPIGVEAEVSAEGERDDSGNADAEGLDTSLSAADTTAAVAAAEVTSGSEGDGEGADGADPADETGIVDGENESGQVNPDGTEASVTDAPADPKLTAMRTSCEGGPEALALNAMIAAHADYE